MREAADGRDLRNTVLHMLEQLGGKLLRLIRDDLEFHGLLEALDHRIADVAGQEAVDQAKTALDKAKAALAKAEEPTKEVSTDALEKAIKAAGALKESDYTADSWKALQSALTEANTALKEKKDQATVDKATENLNKAISALVKKDAGQKANGTSGTSGKAGSGSASNTNNGKAAKTGDPSGLFGWLGLAVTSLGAGIGGFSLKRKKREDEE